MKRIALALALILAALLTGCIVVPAHRYHGGYYEGHDRGGPAHVEPGRGPR